jgi:hypothetical protein
VVTYGMGWYRSLSQAWWPFKTMTFVTVYYSMLCVDCAVTFTAQHDLPLLPPSLFFALLTPAMQRLPATSPRLLASSQLTP